MSKKVAKAPKEFHQYATGDPVLGKVRGYPPWPGVVVDPSDVPPAVTNEQPPGKKATFYCILFFPMGDYAWLHSKDLSSLKKHEIEAFLADDTKKRNGDLRAGYEIALNPQPWMNDLTDSRANLAQAQKEAEENAPIDQLESENDAEGDVADDEEPTRTKKAKSATSKKRKRDSEAAEPAKVPKKAPKAKKGSAEPAKTKKSASTATKSKKNGAKSKAVVESEDEAEAAEPEDEENAGPSKKTSPPPAKKAKREKDEDGDDTKTGDPQSIKVRDWRHKLQKTFLSKSLPKAEAMPEVDALFTTVEKYNGMTIEQLQFSKIGKVMRHIAALAEDKVPPRDDEFKFRTRAKGLVDKWHQILNATKPANGAAVTSPTSAVGLSANDNGNMKDGGADEVTQGTKGLDLNGKGDYASPAVGIAAAYASVADKDQEDDQDGDGVAEADAIGDITMEEA